MVFIELSDVTRFHLRRNNDNINIIFTLKLLSIHAFKPSDFITTINWERFI